MPFLLSDDEDLIQKTVREFAQTQIGLDAAAEMDRHDRFPAEHLDAAAALGLCGMSVPAEAGGAGVSSAAYALAVMELASVCPNTATALTLHSAAAHALHLAGAPVVAQAVAGERVSLLVTEEAHGSDKTRFGTTASEADGAWTLRGQKAWGVGVVGATHLLVAAQAEAGPSLFLVAAEAEGVTLGRNESLMGLRAAGIRTVYFDDAAAQVVGEAGAGLELLAQARPWAHIGIAATLVGATMGAFDAAARFAESRVQFGKPIGTYQAVSDAITDVDLQVHAARALLLEAASRLDASDAPQWAARAKAFATQIAVPATRRAIRIQGGTGFMREGGTERFARDVRCLQFVGEPIEMQRETLKQALLDL